MVIQNGMCYADDRYHGSQNEIVEPRFGLGEDRHDFGKGFYLTDSADLAREWSVCHHLFFDLVREA